VIRFTLNGQPVALDVSGSRNLLWTLRTKLGLTGTKHGCGEGLCGACTVLVDARPVPACRIDLARVEGRHVLTIEGMAANGRLHPLQQAFVDHGAFQCGFCTPGMLLAALALLRRNPHPSAKDVLQALDGHLCRCGAPQRIVAAVQAAGGQTGTGR
jgi:aerobic-type carbon monoxide dehydrogenase small subunit (CoxS/CutS family)